LIDKVFGEGFSAKTGLLLEAIEEYKVEDHDGNCNQK
jgi:hypothetical protein